MPSLIQGRVVYPKLAIPDPQGRNPKEGRPFVVVSTKQALDSGEPIFAVGITSTFDESQSDQYVQLPYGPTARTGLKQQSAALCTWVISISREQVEIGTGYVHPSLVDEIAEKIEALKSVPHVIDNE